MEVEGFSGALPLPCYSLGCFQRFILLSVRQLPDHLINAIMVEEELGRAQSKPTHTKSVRSRLGTGQRPRSKMFLFPFKRVLLSVPLEQLNDQTESLGFTSPSAYAPQINGQLPRHCYDGFFARGAGSKRTFGQEPLPFEDWFVVGLEADQPPG